MEPFFTPNSYSIVLFYFYFPILALMKFLFEPIFWHQLLFNFLEFIFLFALLFLLIISIVKALLILLLNISGSFYFLYVIIFRRILSFFKIQIILIKTMRRIRKYRRHQLHFPLTPSSYFAFSADPLF